jgi:hypothetical protein
VLWKEQIRSRIVNDGRDVQDRLRERAGDRIRRDDRRFTSDACSPPIARHVTIHGNADNKAPSMMP